jgi:hypothetical protein
VLAHHLAYKHVGHEFLFELAALCLECHARVHSINAPGAPEDVSISVPEDVSMSVPEDVSMSEPEDSLDQRGRR